MSGAVNQTVRGARIVGEWYILTFIVGQACRAASECRGLEKKSVFTSHKDTRKVTPIVAVLLASSVLHPV